MIALRGTGIAALLLLLGAVAAPLGYFRVSAPIGDSPVTVRVESSATWLHTSLAKATITQDTTVTVSIDWENAPAFPADARIVVHPEGGTPISIAVHVSALPRGARGFVENAGIVAMDAEDAATNRPAGRLHWKVLPGSGSHVPAWRLSPLVQQAARLGSRALVLITTSPCSRQRSERSS